MEILGGSPTLSFWSHKKTVPSQVIRFIYWLLLQSAWNSNQGWAAYAENGFGEVLHKV